MKCKNQSVYFRFFHWPWEKLKVQQQKPEASQCSRGRGKPLVEEILQENRRTVWTFPAIEVSFKQRPRYKVKGLGFVQRGEAIGGLGRRQNPLGRPSGKIHVALAVCSFSPFYVVQIQQLCSPPPPPHLQLRQLASPHPLTAEPHKTTNPTKLSFPWRKQAHF